MNPWFDYGFGPAYFPLAVPGAFDPRSGSLPAFQHAFSVPGVGIPQAAVPTPYALQPAPGIAAYARQSYAPSAAANLGYASPQAVNPLNPFNTLGAASGPAASWPGFQESSPLRPIGFQPPIGTSSSLTPFQQVLSRIPTDDEMEELISEALDADPVLSTNGEVEVRCESGVVALTGHVQHRRVKYAIGELAWSVPGIVDVQNNLEIAGRRRIRAGLRKDTGQAQAQRK